MITANTMSPNNIPNETVVNWLKKFIKSSAWSVKEIFVVADSVIYRLPIFRDTYVVVAVKNSILIFG